MFKKFLVIIILLVSLDSLASIDLHELTQSVLPGRCVLLSEPQNLLPATLLVTKENEKIFITPLISHVFPSDYFDHKNFSEVQSLNDNILSSFSILITNNKITQDIKISDYSLSFTSKDLLILLLVKKDNIPYQKCTYSLRTRS